MTIDEEKLGRKDDLWTLQGRCHERTANWIQASFDGRPELPAPLSHLRMDSERDSSSCTDAADENQGIRKWLRDSRE
jgi:hypothetical protein